VVHESVKPTYLIFYVVKLKEITIRGTLVSKCFRNMIILCYFNLLYINNDSIMF